jgi:hypothetical protein
MKAAKLVAHKGGNPGVACSAVTMTPRIEQAGRSEHRRLSIPNRLRQENGEERLAM